MSLHYLVKHEIAICGTRKRYFLQFNKVVLTGMLRSLLRGTQSEGIDGAYYRDTQLTQQMLPAIRRILVIALYSSKTVPRHTGHATRFSCYAGKRQTSSDQNSGFQIPQT